MASVDKNSVGEGPQGAHNARDAGAVFDVPARGFSNDSLENPEFEIRERRGQLSRMDSLLGSKERTFWTFQVGGWIGYSFLRTFQAITNGQDLYYFSWVIIAAALVGLSMTTMLRQLYRMARNWPLQWLLLFVVSICGACGLLFSMIELYIAPRIVPGLPPFSGLEMFGNAMFETTALFAWSALYFGYHYYQSMREQQEQVLKATAMAHQAQLKMLRYQLNPHFLFNTLNAISTLVLERAETDANKMLTKLSSFLRFTLVNQPTQRITLEQELYALGLYLDIENVRFEDRLTVNFDIDDDAKTALIPSLLLQPLIENAIKYAIAPSIEGGTICVSAHVDGDKLVVVLKDDGPGIADLGNIVSQSGSGVGIVNTKERLMQIYGPRHRFTLQNREPRGLGIFIEIPCEREKRS
ncbi:sensor histidine kinase [Kordiimonas aestuarii]|uniref:sensor histidine kinase n=1 Tax=Kordiimonas aestuarii TaxID=1005925 RepID=UPI0021D2F735|nr:histidine kinase [Kordiimonas aestuarii]